MSEDESLLRGMVAAPEDAAARLVYADWLDERDDPRAALLRHDWDAPRINFPDWVERQGNLPYYIATMPAVQDELEGYEANRRVNERLAALGGAIDPDWLAVADSLGRPFRPFFFWNNTGPRSFQPGELPFIEPIGTRGTVLTFESAFRGERAWQPGLAQDLRFLRELPMHTCEYGAASCPTHPFICELGPKRRLTGAGVLAALKVREFRSQHIASLNATTIANPGYHPGTDNDEVHTAADGQYLFPRLEDVPEDDEEGFDDGEYEGSAARHATHTALREYVAGKRLWYVLLHSRAEPLPDGFDRHTWVVLFAVGRSPHGDRLLGVVSHQLCHNLCD